MGRRAAEPPLCWFVLSRARQCAAHPAVDADTGLTIAESGAIMLWLAEVKGGARGAELMPAPAEPAKRGAVLQWLFWQNVRQPLFSPLWR